MEERYGALGRCLRHLRTATSGNMESCVNEEEIRVHRGGRLSGMPSMPDPILLQLTKHHLFFRQKKVFMLEANPASLGLRERGQCFSTQATKQAEEETSDEADPQMSNHASQIIAKDVGPQVGQATVCKLTERLGIRLASM